MKKRTLKWQVGYADTLSGECEKIVDAAVPGAVQLDWAHGTGMPKYWVEDNYKLFEWMEDKYWIYTSIIDFECSENEKAILTFHGIDYRYKIEIDEDEIHSGEGMFSHIKIDVTKYIKATCVLKVIIYPVPKATDEKDRTQASRSFKPAVSYGWDWHPRLVPSGIWDDAYIEIVPEKYIRDLEVHYTLSEDLKSVDINIALDLSKNSIVEFILEYKDGSRVFSQKSECNEGVSSHKIEITDPKLWWTREFGEQAFYNLIATIKDKATGSEVYSLSKRIGFRKIRLVMNKSEWEKPDKFPKTRSTPPITIELNDKKIFAKGSNWVNPEIFSGIITKSTYKELLELVLGANMNMLRIWGGGIVNKESFYDLCDEMGIMVWQEFMLSCNKYPDDDCYLSVLENESVNIVKRLRVHPCLVIWCGGNELFNSWSKMTDQSHALRLLNKVCYENDRHTPFLPTSPIFGMSHGHYHNKNHESPDIISSYIESDYTAYTEFGSPGPSPAEYIKSFIAKQEYEKIAPGSSWEHHHAVNAWTPSDTWLRTSEAEYYFGGYSDVDDLIDKCTLINCITVKSIFEEIRKHWPQCSMAINWCFNEPWPTAANNSLVNWPAIPKKSYFSVKEALRSQMSSLRVHKHGWEPEEEFFAEIWLLNDSAKKLSGSTLNAYIQIDNIKKLMLSWTFGTVEPQKNLKGPSIFYALPDTKDSCFKILLEIENMQDLNSEYVYIIRAIKKNSVGKGLLNI